MKYETKTTDDGHVHLQLGLTHGVSFEPPLDINDVVQGVENLVEATIGVSVFELVAAVLKEANMIEEDGQMKEQTPVG